MMRRSVHPSHCRCAGCTGPRHERAPFVLHRDPARPARTERLTAAAGGLAIVAAFLVWSLI